jgi:RNA polymerase sigma-70 factor (ECF subfamily)
VAVLVRHHFREGRILALVPRNNPLGVPAFRREGVIVPDDGPSSGEGRFEAELLVRASRGDEPAFLTLYERHRGPVFRFACRLLGSAAQAEDVTQECFLSVLRRPRAFQADRASLRTYLCAIARHLAWQHLRRSGFETTVEDLPESPCAEAEMAEPFRHVVEGEIRSAVRAAVDDLSPLQREAIVLFEYEGLNLAEIALVCDTDVGTVKARLHRARERLRRALAPQRITAPIAVAVGERR